jgi:hypothetical protein
MADTYFLPIEDKTLVDTYLLPIEDETLVLSFDKEVIKLPLTNEDGCMDSRYRIQGFKKLPDETIIKKYQFEKIDYDYPSTATIKHDRQGYVIDTFTYDAVKGLLTVTYDASDDIGFIELLIEGTYPTTEKLEYLQTLEIVAVGVFI